MGRRIDVELTSSSDDGSWTWRAAGAKKPKGSLSGSVLYDGAKVGDVVRAEAEYHVDGIEITEVTPPKAKKERTNLLAMEYRALRDDELVTTQRVKRNDRGGRDNRSGGKGGRNRDRDRSGDRRNDRGSSNRKPPRDEQPLRPKPKRLRAKRVHREALLAEVGEEFRPIIEQLLRDGMPGVRKAIEKQNAEAKEAGKPELDATPILSIAENNVSKARIAEWRDKVDAALADADELDLRDLRSVVVSGADLARDESDRQLADEVKTVLDRRVEKDHQEWLSDLEAAIKQERVVRALRLSSRPVKAGAPLPAEMATALSEHAAKALAADVMQDRWATVLDALAFSPVRSAVTPAGIPAEPSEDLLADVRRLSDRVPEIAKLFSIDPATVPKSAKRRRPRRKPADKKPKSKVDKPSQPKAPKRPRPGSVPSTPEQDPTATDAADVEAPPAKESTEAESTDTESTETAADAQPVETSAPDAPAAEEASAESPVAGSVEAESPDTDLDATAEVPVEEPAAEGVPVEETAAEEAVGEGEGSVPEPVDDTAESAEEQPVASKADAAQ